MKLTEKFEEILGKHVDFAEWGTDETKCLQELIQAVKERDAEVLGSKIEFPVSKHDLKHYSAVNMGIRFKYYVVKQRMEETL